MIYDNTKVLLVDLPPSTKGVVTKKFDNGEDFYTILLNSSIGVEEQKKAYLHECSHIVNDDFREGANLDVVESLRHENLY